MKTPLVLATALSSAVLMAAESENSLFETSAARISTIATEEAEAEVSILKAALSILESDRPALKATGVNSESRELKIGAEVETSAIKSVLSILEMDRPAVKATGVNSEGRALKAEAAADTANL